ncbi:hypothetical protein QYS62_005153 [Fusarium acuminatum]|uniref:Uncharacterized protein n=1 Tax=Fusarium acuminatum TaxID=5515 RepID=A0ABZ2WW50_9HYPO
MASSPTSNPTSGASLLAKFQADYWANPPSAFALAYSKALLSPVSSTRDAEVDAVLNQYGYESLTQAQIDSVISPNDTLDSPFSSPSSSRPTSPTPSQNSAAPPTTQPDTMGASSWIFLAFGGSYNVTSDSFPAATTEVVVGQDGTLNLGTNQSKLNSTVLMDSQDKPWVQWDVTPNVEWYIAQFSASFDSKLNSTVRNLNGFHCVVGSDNQSTNTPISAQCSTLKPDIKTKNVTAATSALTKSCQEAAAGAVRDWSTVIVESNPSSLNNEVSDYMADHNLMNPSDVERTSGYFLKAVDQKVLAAYKKVAGAKGSMSAGLNAISANYLQLELLKRQMGGLTAKIQNSAETAEAGVNSAHTTVEEAEQRASQSKAAWDKLVEQVNSTDSKADNYGQLKKDEALASEAAEADKTAALTAAKDLQAAKDAQSQATEDAKAWQNEKDQSEENHSKLEEQIKHMEKGVTGHLEVE